jgi:glycosyltransferase involved in cell wall biosynthesis
LKTGFGRVNSHALTSFLSKGMEVATVTGLQTEKSKPETDLPVKLYVPADDDPMGLRRGVEAIDEFEPDVIYTTGDPGNVGTYAGIIPARIPYVSYVPIEGEPIVHQGWRELLSYLPVFTCSQYGVDVVRRDLGKDIDFVYHGVDSDVFTPLTDDERDAYRKRLGWEGKFVIACVAQNVRRKQLPRLIEAVAILKRQFKQKDVVLYLHTVPFQRHILEGWNLPEIARAFGVHEEVIFNPLLAEAYSAIPERGDMEVPGLRELMGAADLFVLPSQVEGFGLPIVESMAVGTPVMVTKYGAGWEVARLGGGAGVRPHDFEVHKSGTRYANVDPMELAKEILRLKRNPAQLARMRKAGLEAVSLFDWSAFEEKVAERVRHAAEAEAQSASAEAAHQAEVEGAAEDRLPEGEVGARA